MNFKALKKVKLKQKVFLMIIFFLLFILGVIFFIIIPAVNDIKEIRGQIEEQRTDLEVKYLKGQSIKKISEKLEEVKPKIAELDKVFINKNRDLDFITILEDIANKNNISQKINLLSTDDKKGVYQSVPLQLFVSGYFLDCINYLTELEELSYYININSIKITSGGQSVLDEQGNYESKVDILINANTYWK